MTWPRTGPILCLWRRDADYQNGSRMRPTKEYRRRTPQPHSGTARMPRPAGPSISACLIVKNEEANLLRCLGSIRSSVDEIVVVDTGSTDRTVSVAESLGARVFHFEWCDDFSAARNESLRHAIGDWIIWVDGD